VRWRRVHGKFGKKLEHVLVGYVHRTMTETHIPKFHVYCCWTGGSLLLDNTAQTEEAAAALVETYKSRETTPWYLKNPNTRFCYIHCNPDWFNYPLRPQPFMRTNS